jgi:large subunit ribosomal protein L25
MARPQLAAEPRAVLGKQVSTLRRSGRLPGVVYGAGRESQPISLDLHEFQLLHRKTGRHAVLDLTIGEDRKTQPVLLQAIQEHPINRLPIHVDLMVVNLQEEMTVDVAIVAVGESEAVDKMGGVLLHLRETVVVRAKPDDLPSGIEIDITALDSFDAALHASDLVMPAGVTLVTDASEPILRVQQPRVEEEAVAGEAEAADVGEGAPAAEGSAEGGESGATEESSES